MLPDQSTDKNVRVDGLSHHVLKVINSHTGLPLKELIGLSTYLIAAKHSEISKHFPDGYLEEKAVKTND